jgi:hypothetical protein
VVVFLSCVLCDQCCQWLFFCPVSCVATNKQPLATLATQDTGQKNPTKTHNTETSKEEQHGPHHKSGGEPRCSCRINQFLRIHQLCYSYAQIIWSLYIYFTNGNGSSSFYIYFVFPLSLDCTMSNRCVL